MSDNVELSGLSIKDLRHMAGEHHISNRSRMGRSGLIQALAKIVAGAAAQGAAPVAQEKVVHDKAAHEKKTQEKKENVVTGDSENNSAEEVLEAAAPLAAAPAAEPEVLDAAAVAGLVQSESSSDARRGRRTDRTSDTAATSRTEANKNAPAAVRPVSTSPSVVPVTNSTALVSSVVATPALVPASSVPVSGTSTPVVAAAPVAPVARGPAPTFAGQPPISTMQANRQPDRPGNPPQLQQQRPMDPRQQSQDPRSLEQRAPRPRLEGQLRHMPSVLDRLCIFTRGILELCDPSTPSWAQARLSELLAEAGLVPLPCQGQPHPDFHHVVGTVIAKDIPLGNIAVVDVPGFALRGDRGDLFPQRKAQVRISGEREERIAPQVAVVSRPPSSQQFSQPSSQQSSTNISAQQPRPVAAPVVSPRADVRPVAAPTDRSGTQSQVAPVRDPAASVSAPAPQQGRDPLQTHHREIPSESPKLPLAAQEPSELAQKPKAESFRPLGLNEQILADIAATGWTEPSPIQMQAIPVALTGRDLIGQAQTGTGKTGAFLLPILQKLYSIEDQDRRPVALILCPTRELAKQVANEFGKMAGASGARAAVIYGGTPMDEQFRAIERCPHVIIGTPGRVIDHMKRHSLDFSRLSVLALDEADQMLDIGFWPDVQYILGHTPPTRQILLFSATFPEPVRVMAEKHMKTPEHIRITPKVVTVDQVDQKYIAIPRDRKNDLLAHFIDIHKPESLLVFCRTRHQTDRVAEVLKRKHYSAGAIHGDLPQTKREKLLSQFRAGELKCLIATNVAARGLDIPIVSHVVNYDIPEMPEEYVHRIGRTARNGAPGVARTFISPDDGQFLVEIEKHIGLLLEEEQVDGFTPDQATADIKRTIADAPVVTARLIKPLTGGIRLGRRRR